MNVNTPGNSQNSLTQQKYKCIYELFEAQVERNSNAVAVVFEQECLTYRQLNSRANLLAHYLQALGVGPEVLVGIFMERSLEMLVGLLGILKAGGAYVPLDPAYPTERLAFMLEDTQISVLLTQARLVESLPKHQAQVVCPDTQWEEIAQQSKENPISAAKPDNLAYVIYTSGSTGKPKGVAMSHRPLSNLIIWQLESSRLPKGAKTLQFAPVSFDVSFQEIFSTWCSGGTLVLIREQVRVDAFELLRFLTEQEINRFFLPFVALQQLASVADAQGAVIPTLREIITAGEQLQITRPITNWLTKLKNCTLHNHYGPSESHVVTAFTLTGSPSDWPALPPIGQPITNTQIYLLDSQMQQVSEGVPGELYIGGIALARGYLNRPDLTTERFIPDPNSSSLQARLYKTGDLARYLPDGNIEFLGRSDDQVKIRGFRIELGEIEVVIAAYPAVRQTVVLAREDVPGDKRLVAYIVPSSQESSPHEQSVEALVQAEQVSQQQNLSSQLVPPLRSYLKARLPEYMVPSAFVVLEAFPVTPSGKVDRRALPDPQRSRPELETVLVMPQSDAEQLIAKVWLELLQLEGVGIHDNFFDLGGNSLLLNQSANKLAEIFGVKLSIVELFQYPTISTLAQRLSQTERKSPVVTTHKPRRFLSRQFDQIGESNIAIIGMSGRFPGAKDIEAFWQNLRDGVESISFFSDEELSQSDPTLLSNQNYVKANAVLPNIEKFDASFFGYSIKEAEIMDPQQRIFLECAWEALESAGYNPETYQGSIGVYAGSGMNTYLINNVHPNQGFSSNRTFLASASDLQVRLSNGNDYLPTRVSYKLNLTGPSVNIQTACSTALVAVHMAIQSLLNGECDMALAGGIAVSVPQKAGYLYQEDMIWSNDGHCRAFDAQATGTVFGNGGGIVVLKLLEAAITDGDYIHAVIKGSAINNDGAAKVGYTAPSVEGQTAVISEALAIAQIDPSTITYVETHGTATSLGDPIEIAALTQAFHQSTKKKGFCAIGSVKTNIGHIAEAAGIAGLIKTVLALKHKYLPPSLHFSQPNPNIDFAQSPFYVNTTLSEWKANETPRRAGVSAFGIGGTNCHVVLQEAPEQVKSQKSKVKNDRTLHILTLSAKSQKALEELAQNYVVYLQSNADASIADICFTANAGRKHFNHRLAVTAFSVEQLGSQLKTFGQQTTSASNTQTNTITSSVGAIAFIFTGQGSQYVNMGRQLYETQHTFRQTLDRCNEILRPLLKKPLLEVLYPQQGESLPDIILEPKSQIDETAYTQPALFALEYALFQLWKSWGIEPDVVMGHSVGEYVAACVAGVFSLEDGLKLIALRGRLMQALATDGEMVAIQVSKAQAEAVIRPYKEVSIGAVNTPQSTVISGGSEAINAICNKLEASGVKTKKLNVSHAFHSPLMQPMLAAFEQVARQMSFCSPQIKLISNVTGELATEEVATPEYWCSHIIKPVRFAASVETLDRLGIETLVEIGPKPILLGMARSCLPDSNKLWLASLRPEQDDWQVLLASLAELYMHGVSVNWLGFDQDYSRRRLNLPTYPFQRQRYWIEASKGYARDALFQKNGVGNQTLHPLLGQQLYLAATQEIQIRFQSQISPDSSFWLREHCLFGRTILPGTAYLEMALAAGSVLTKSDNLWLEDVVLRQAMIWQSDEAKTVQVILTPQSADVYSFEIYSLFPPAEKNNGQPSWTIHASGKLLVKEKESVTERVDLAALKAQCTKEFPIVELYRRFQEQDLNYGSSFRGMEQLLHHKTVALGKIRLGEKLVWEIENYQLHPVLLDIALQVMEAISPNHGKQISYVPVGLERLRICDRPSDSMWSHAQLRNIEDAHQHQQNLSANLQLFTDSGELIAVLEGLQIKAVRSSTMLGMPQESWKNWLYEVEWLSQVLNDHSGDDMPDGVIAAPAGTETKSKVGKTKNWLIFADSQGIGQQLVARLRSLGESCIIILPASKYEQVAEQEFRIDPANPEHFQQLCEAVPSVHGVVHGWSLDAPPTQTGEDLEVASRISCGSALYLVQALAQKYSEPPRLWLVTQGAQAVGVASGVPGLAQSPLWGMGQVIALEHPELNCILVDLDPDATDVERVIIEEITSETSEGQVVFRDGTRYVARLVRSQPEASWLRSESFRLEICERGILDNLQLVPTHRRQPGSGEVEIRVCATGLNFIDVLDALGTLPFERDNEFGVECAGEIVAIGEGVEDYRVGDAVMAIAFGSFSKYVTVSSQLVTPIPNGLNFEKAAAIPVNFVTAYYALHQIANITAKDKVLIHAAAGGTGMAAVKLALAAGSEVFATASPGKWDSLKSMGVQHIYNSRTLDFAEQVMADTSGQGVDIILNSLTGVGFIEKSLSVLSPKGRFLEIAKRDVWETEQVQDFKADILYHFIDLRSICLQQPELVQPILHYLSEQFALKQLDLSPLKVFPIQEVISAFRYMQRAEHIGKIVVSQPKGISDAASHSVSFRSDSSYLITGGLGDLGLTVARWMVECGARHLVLVGRSAVKPAIRSQLDQLELSGARVVVAQADVSDYEQVAQLLASLDQSSPPLRGIIHAAGVLDDGVLKQLDWNRFARVMAPKVQGAWNLHVLTQNLPLDFFVLFSSCASLLGSAGQANYVAANAFLDTLAFYRRSLGAPCTSINWGAWGEIGMAARNRQVIERLNHIGMGAIAPSEGLQVLEQLFVEQPVRVGVVPLNWSQFREEQWTASPFFTNFTKVSEQSSKQPVAVEFRKQLEAAPVRERKALLGAHVSSQVAQVLGWNPSNSLDLRRGFFEMGIDSLTSIELRNRLQTSLGCSVASTLVFDYPTVEALVNYLAQEVLSALIVPDSELWANSSIAPPQKEAEMMSATEDLNNKEKSIEEIAKQLAEQLGLS
ncbi:MAG: amino acid adenylation domain-containing protein [Rhizonema sp. PD38]|nr:amino acid adenylation domain-containing protein [Rhizonema sp. PD38]